MDFFDVVKSRKQWSEQIEKLAAIVTYKYGTLTLIKHTKDIIRLQRKFREWYYMPGNRGHDNAEQRFSVSKTEIA